MAFHGTFDHSLDAKNRLTIPSKFRAALSGPVFLVRGAEPCISVYPERVYGEMAEQALSGLNPLSAQYKRLSRFFYSNADDVALDVAGRITLHARHLEHAGLTGREAVITGTGASLEIWDRGAWERYDAELAEHASELTESLGHPS